MISYAIKPKIFILLLFLTNIGKTTVAQTKLDPQVTASSGQHLDNSTVHMDFTLGEFMTRNVKGSSQITQGFQQSQLSIMIPVIEPSFEGKITVSPNPFTAILTVSVQHEGDFEVTIYNLLGAALIQKKFSETALIDMQKLPPGNYGLIITEENDRVYTSVIEKAK